MKRKRIDIYGDGIGAVEYIDHMGTDVTVVNAARVSFGKEINELSQKDVKLISYLIKNKHTSTLEHNIVTLRFTVPLFIRSQHHRHRTWSYNEISRRYTSERLQFYEPNSFRAQHSSNRQASQNATTNPVVYSYEDGGEVFASTVVKNHHRQSIELYELLLDKGVCREQARGVLPQNLYTQYYGTVNLNNLLKFIGLRTHEGAQWEIRVLAEACLDIVSELWPKTVHSYRKIVHNCSSG